MTNHKKQGGKIVSVRQMVTLGVLLILVTSGVVVVLKFGRPSADVAGNTGLFDFSSRTALRSGTLQDVEFASDNLLELKKETVAQTTPTATATTSTLSGWSKLNFDDLPKGTNLTNKYETSHGVVFSGNAGVYVKGGDLGSSACPPTGKDTEASSQPYFATGGNMDITFKEPVDIVRLKLISVGYWPVTVKAYDVAGQVISTREIVHKESGSDIGTCRKDEFSYTSGILSTAGSSSSAVAKIELRPHQNIGGADFYGFDDLEFFRLNWPRRVTFDELNKGIEVAKQYETSRGVIFSGNAGASVHGGDLGSAACPPTGKDTEASSQPYFLTGANMTITFKEPMDIVRFKVISVGYWPVTVKAYDTAGKVITTRDFVHKESGSDIGTCRREEFSYTSGILSTAGSSSSSVAKIELLPHQNADLYGIDDVEFMKASEVTAALAALATTPTPTATATTTAPTHKTQGIYTSPVMSAADLDAFTKLTVVGLNTPTGTAVKGDLMTDKGTIPITLNTTSSITNLEQIATINPALQGAKTLQVRLTLTGDGSKTPRLSGFTVAYRKKIATATTTTSSPTVTSVTPTPTVAVTTATQSPTTPATTTALPSPTPTTSTPTPTATTTSPVVSPISTSTSSTTPTVAATTPSATQVTTPTPTPTCSSTKLQPCPTPPTTTTTLPSPVVTQTAAATPTIVATTSIPTATTTTTSPAPTTVTPVVSPTPTFSPPTAPTPTETQTSQAKFALDSGKGSYTEGEKITITVTNTGTSKLRFPDSPPATIFRVKQGSVVVGPRPVALGRPALPFDLSPNEHFSLTWDQKGTLGTQVAPGSYELELEVTASGKTITGRIPITITARPTPPVATPATPSQSQPGTTASTQPVALPTLPIGTGTTPPPAQAQPSSASAPTTPAGQSAPAGTATSSPVAEQTSAPASATPTPTASPSPTPSPTPTPEAPPPPPPVRLVDSRTGEEITTATVKLFEIVPKCRQVRRRVNGEVQFSQVCRGTKRVLIAMGGKEVLEATRPVGKYRVEITARGYKKFIFEGQLTEPGPIATGDLTLQSTKRTRSARRR